MAKNEFQKARAILRTSSRTSIINMRGNALRHLDAFARAGKPRSPNGRLAKIVRAADFALKDFHDYLAANRTEV